MTKQPYCSLTSVKHLPVQSQLEFCILKSNFKFILWLKVEFALNRVSCDSSINVQHLILNSELPHAYEVKTK